MQPVSLLLASMNAALLWMLWKVVVRKPFDIVSIFLMIVGATLVLRPILISTGLDDLWPSDLFGNSSQALLVDGQLLVSLWIFASGAGVLSTRAFPISAWHATGRTSLTSQHLFRATLVLVALATVVTIPLWIEFGGPTGLATAFKIDKSVDRTYLRLVPLIAAIFSSASYLAATADYRSRRGSRLLRLGLFACAAALSYSWGARDAPVFGVLALILGTTYFGPRPGVRPRRLVLGLLVVLVLAFGLRLVRDSSVQGGVAEAITEQNVVGQVAVAANLVSFDSFLLVVRDGPPGGEYHGGSDFETSFLSVIPGLADRTADSRSVALQVAQTYRPQRRNGWPVNPIGDWYINFGPAGVALGGFISGALLGYLQRKLANADKSPILFSVSVFVGGTWLAGGIWARSVFGWLFAFALVLAIRLARYLGPGEIRDSAVLGRLADRAEMRR